MPLELEFKVCSFALEGSVFPRGCYLELLDHGHNPEEHNTIFHTGYRITGTPENVHAALALAGVSLADIQQVLVTSITRDNYNTTMADVFKQELTVYDAIKRKKNGI
jgi:hypothetical protein